jgi:hypothetical protein
MAVDEQGFALSLQTRLNDGGPVYWETDLRQVIAEPWNTVSAALFVLVACWGLWRIGRHWREHALLVCFLPVLLAGGIGGTVYHATRSHRFWFLLDWFPIVLLVLGVSFAYWARLGRRWTHGMMIAIPVLAVLSLLMNWIATWEWVEPSTRLTVHYAAMAALVLLPIGLYLGRTHWRHASWVLAAMASIGLALAGRLLDSHEPALLPMGTHFLWHGFGALSTLLLCEFVFRCEGAGWGRGEPVV